MSLGQKIKHLREELNLTQEELGKILNVSKPTISRYEANTNEPNTDTLKKIAQYFNVSIDYLLDNSNKKNPNIEINIQKEYTDTDKKILDDISSLDNDLKKEAEKYIELLKLKQSMDKSKEEQSATSEQDA